MNTDIEVVSDKGVIEAQERAQIDIQINTAKRFPRDVGEFQTEIKRMCANDPETAEQCFYAIPRAGGFIYGPTVRMMELVAQQWGNCDAAARVIDIGDRYVTAQGVFRDWQRNTRIVKEVQQKIVDKKGERYSEDMVMMNANAAASKALRNAIRAGIPEVLWQHAYQAARDTATDEDSGLSKLRSNMINYFERSFDVTITQILRLLDKKQIQDIDREDISNMKGVATAITNQETTVEEAFELDRPGAQEQIEEGQEEKQESDDSFKGKMRQTAKKEEASESAPDDSDEDVVVPEGVRIARYEHVGAGWYELVSEEGEVVDKVRGNDTAKAYIDGEDDEPSEEEPEEESPAVDFAEEADAIIAERKNELDSAETTADKSKIIQAAINEANNADWPEEQVSRISNELTTYAYNSGNDDEEEEEPEDGSEQDSDGQVTFGMPG